MEKLRGSLCCIVSYRHPNYIRTDNLLSFLSKNKNLKTYKALNTFSSPLRYIETFLKFLFIRIFYNPDYYLIGFRGHELFLFIYPFIFNKKIIFDEFVSPYDSYVNERKVLKNSAIRAKIIYTIEKFILSKSWRILTDTESNKNYYAKLFKINPEKFWTIPLSAGSIFLNKLKQIKKTKNPYNKDKFNVFFYGTMLPLHGIDVIYKTAKILKTKDPDIHFTIIGRPEYKDPYINEYLKKLTHLNNVTYKRWVNLETLILFIKSSDLCLGGPFGTTNQAKRVVTGKTIHFLALKKPTIVGINPETKKLKNQNVFFVKLGDHKSLANLIIYLKIKKWKRKKQ